LIDLVHREHIRCDAANGLHRHISDVYEISHVDRSELHI